MIIYFKHKGESVKWNLESDKISQYNNDVFFDIEKNSLLIHFNRQNFTISNPIYNEELSSDNIPFKPLWNETGFWFINSEQNKLYEYIKEEHKIVDIKLENPHNVIAPFNNTLINAENNKIVDYFTKEIIYHLPFYMEGKIEAIDTEGKLMAIGTDKGEVVLIKKNNQHFDLLAVYQLPSPIKSIFISNKILIAECDLSFLVWNPQKDIYPLETSYHISKSEIEDFENGNVVINCYISRNYLLLQTTESTYFVNLNICNAEKVFDYLGISSNIILNDQPYIKHSIKINDFKKHFSSDNKLIRQFLDFYSKTEFKFSGNNLQAYNIDNIGESIRNKDDSIVLLTSYDINIQVNPSKNFGINYYGSAIQNPINFKEFRLEKAYIDGTSSIIFKHSEYKNLILFMDISSAFVPDQINFGLVLTPKLFNEVFVNFSQDTRRIIKNMVLLFSKEGIETIFFTKASEKYLKQLNELSSNNLKPKIIQDLVEPIRNSIIKFKF